MNGRTIGVGLLGYGLAGSIFHAPVIAAVPRLALRTVMTSRAGDVARDLPGAAVVATPERIFDDPSIELVVIATPNPTHADLARQALHAGKHVVIDKPMTVTSAEADALIALARDRGRLLCAYQNRRWDNDFLTVKDVIDSGRLGRIFTYEAHYDRFRPALKPGWREERAPGSGLLFDLGSHLIDQALVLFGLPQTVSADVLVRRPNAVVDDYFTLVLAYPELRVILGASTIVADPGPHFAVHGDAGSFVKYGMDAQEAALKARLPVGGAAWGTDSPDAFGTLVAADGTRETLPTIAGNYAGFYASLAGAILDGGAPPVTGEQGRDVVRVVELAHRSSLERRTVAL